MNPAQMPKAPPKPTTAAAVAQGPTISELLSMVTDETIRLQLQQQAVDQYSAQRTAVILGTVPAKIELQIKYGRSYGFNEIQSQEWIYLYPNKDGTYKPLLDYKGRAFLLKNAGYDWRPVEWSGVKAEFAFYKNGEAMVDANGKPLTICWTIEDAAKAGLVDRARSNPKPGEKQEADGTYDRYPRRMLFAKVIHDFGAVFAQEVSGAGMVDRFDGPTLDEVVVATEAMKMPMSTDDVEGESNANIG